MDGASLRDAMRELVYVHHGGSGSGLTLSDVMGMEIQEFRDWQAWLAERRDTEAKALRDAYRRGRSR